MKKIVSEFENSIKIIILNILLQTVFVYSLHLMFLHSLIQGSRLTVNRKCVWGEPKMFPGLNGIFYVH